jgi:hypothetical protein
MCLRRNTRFVAWASPFDELRAPSLSRGSPMKTASIFSTIFTAGDGRATLVEVAPRG